MVWAIRKDIAAEDQANRVWDYADDVFTIEIHHGGCIVYGKEKEYIGGKISYVDNCDADTMSVHEVHEMLAELGYKDKCLVYYLQPDCMLDNGLHVLQTDKDVIEFCKWTETHKTMKIYCQHGVQAENNDLSPWVEAGICEYAKNVDDVMFGKATNVSAAILEEVRSSELMYNTVADGIRVDAANLISEGNIFSDMAATFEDNDSEPSHMMKTKVNKRKAVNKRKPFAQHGDWGDIPRRHGDDIQISPRDMSYIEQDESNKETDGNIMENMADDELRSTDGSSDEDEQGFGVKYLSVDKKTDNDSMPPNFYIGQRFCDANEFREAIKNYSIYTGKPVKLKTNESKRIRAKCKAPCNWLVYASIIQSEGSKDLVVKTIVDDHEGCTHSFKNRNMTAKWLANRYVERIRTNPHMPIRELRQTVDEEYMTEITRPQAYRARRIALKIINGSDAIQYANIWNYCAEIKRTHPNSTLEVEFTPFRDQGGQPRFMRLYCCLGPLKAGFKAGCRPLIGLDGCHLKGAYPGQLLTAIGVDANNGWWPIAWAVVEKEAREQWLWFLQLLNKDLEVENMWRFTFISDMQKGLASAMAEVLPSCEHRYCVLHMYRNFKKLHPGKALKNKLWTIATSTTMEMYESAMEDMKEYDVSAYEWVKNVAEPKHWVKAFFSTHTQCDMIVNNLCESFNGHIREARTKPILRCLEDIREYVMQRIQKRRDWMSKFEHPVGPLVKQAIDNAMKHSRRWVPLWNGAYGYQIKGPCGVQFAVDVRKKECTCRLWALSGIPCVHGIVALKEANLDPYEHTADCYKAVTFQQIYANVLYPINSMEHWPNVEMVKLDPPIPFAQPGRPRKARRRDALEGKDHGKKRKMRRVVKVHCRKCGSTGHNAATCKGFLMQEDVELDSLQSSRKKQPVKKKNTKKTTESSMEHLQSNRKKQAVNKNVTAPIEMVGAPIANAEHVANSRPTELNMATGPIDMAAAANPIAMPSASTTRRIPQAVQNRTGKKHPLTDADKHAINMNYAWLGKDPPFPVGNWPRRAGYRGGRRGAGGRGAGGRAVAESGSDGRGAVGRGSGAFP